VSIAACSDEYALPQRMVTKFMLLAALSYMVSCSLCQKRGVSIFWAMLEAGLL